MRKTLLNLSAVVLGLLLIPATSCNDDFTEKDALLLQSEMEGSITYTIQVVAVDKTAFVKSTASSDTIVPVGGALVTTSQEGKIVSKATDKNGLVVFEKMRTGNVTVNVNRANYTTVVYIADLTPIETAIGAIVGDQPLVQRSAATIVPVFPIDSAAMALVKGVARIETDLTNMTPEIAAGAKVTALLDVSSPAFAAFYQNIGGSINDQGAGRIVKMAFSDAVFSTTTSAEGSYSLLVPASGEPGVPIALEISDFETNQSLLMNTLNNLPITGVQQIRTKYGQDILPSFIPFVSAAFADVSLPVGAAAMVTTPATATAFIDNSNGISSVHITNSGESYTNSNSGRYNTTIYNLEGGQYIDRGARGQIYISNGRVTHVIITASGSNYTNPVIDLGYVVDHITESIIVNNNSFRGRTIVTGGLVTGIAMSGLDSDNNPLRSGRYRRIPTNVSYGLSDAGGALLTPNWSFNAANNFWFVSSFTITQNTSHPNYGSAVNNQLVTLSYTTLGSPAEGTCLLTTGSLTSIAVTNPGAGYYTAPEVIISGGGGSGASATAHLDPNTRKVAYITIANSGSGYTSSPNIQLMVRDIMSKASISLNFNNEGVITGASVTNGGNGYFSVPTIAINPAITGIGSGAEAIASINQNTGQVIGVQIIKGGAGYMAGNNPTLPIGVNFPKNIMAISGKTYIRDIELGTGKRLIEN